MLRPYQETAIEEIRAHFAAGLKRVLLHMATGAGKTVIFSTIIIASMNRGRRSLVLIRGRKLIDQASKRLFRESVSHGVMMSGHWNFKPQAPIQVASIDTLIARNWRPKADIIIIDEAHMAVSEGYRQVLADYPDAYIVAVTATPYSKKSMRHFADAIVQPVSMNELIEQGYLVPARYYAPREPNVSKVKVSKSTGDYVTKELSAVMDTSSITGDIVSHWRKLADGWPTICFAVDVQHSKHLAEQFRSAGIAAEHCDADTKEDVREAILKRSEAGVTKVIMNVGIWTTGADLPWIRCVIDAAPTKSYNLYIQKLGRGTRPFPGKDFFLVLDHAGNVTRHGFINLEPEPNLEGQPISTGVKPKRCEACFAVVEEFPCPAELFKEDEEGNERFEACGWEPPKRDRAGGPRELTQVDGDLQELLAPGALELQKCEDFCAERLERAIAGGKSPWHAYYATEERFGVMATKMVFFRLCKKAGVDPRKKSQKKTEEIQTDEVQFPFK